MEVFMSVKIEEKACPLKTPKTENKVCANCKRSESEKICSFCAEGSYWCRLDSSEVICPHISYLKNGKCPKFRKLE